VLSALPVGLEGIVSKPARSIPLGGTEFYMRQVSTFYIGLMTMVAALITVLAYFYPGP
jgi:hypothetical protein